jgi:hypothetical protein
MRTVVTCIYGGMMTKDGTPWDEQTSAEVCDKIAERIRGLIA